MPLNVPLLVAQCCMLLMDSVPLAAGAATVLRCGSRSPARAAALQAADQAQRDDLQGRARPEAKDQDRQHQGRHEDGREEDGLER